MSDRDIDKCPNCTRNGDGTPLHACGEVVYACCECDIYWYWCRSQLQKIDIGAIDTYFFPKKKKSTI